MNTARTSRAAKGARSRPRPGRQVTTATGAGPEPPATKPVPEPPSKSGAKLRLDDPVQTVLWGGQVLNTRRAVVGSLTAVAVALGGNLGGITSRLLALDGGKLAAALQLDIIIPVNGFRRYVDYGNGYEFVYPGEWLGDQTLALRQAQRAEASRSLDPPSLADRKGGRSGRDVVLPSAAFGPAGSSGEENVSVVVAPIADGFQLSSLGAPRQAAARFLETIAPASSPRTATLLAASSRLEGEQEYYELEYLVQGPAFFRHNLSTYTTRDNLLYTFNVQLPEAVWPRDGPRLKVAASSFRLLPQTPASRAMADYL